MNLPYANQPYRGDDFKPTELLVLTLPADLARRVWAGARTQECAPGTYVRILMLCVYGPSWVRFLELDKVREPLPPFPEGDDSVPVRLRHTLAEAKVYRKAAAKTGESVQWLMRDAVSRFTPKLPE